MKKVVLALLILAQLTVAMTVSAGGYPSVEEAADALIKAIAANDFDAALAMSDSEQKASLFSWSTMVSRSNMYNPYTMDLPAPDAYDAFFSINKAVSQGRRAMYLYLFISSFLTTDGLGESFTDVDQAWLDGFVEKIDPSRLAGFSILGFADPYKANDERMITLFTEQAAQYGADEKVEKIVIYNLDERVFYGGLTFLRFGSDWYVSAYTSVLANVNAFGVVTEIPNDRVEEVLQELEVTLWK